MRKFVDFSFGVIYSGKEKINVKLNKWIGIVRDPLQRQKWEQRIISQGFSYRKDLFTKLQEKIHKSDFVKSNHLENSLHAADEESVAKVYKGEIIRFWALNLNTEKQGVVVATNIEPSGRFFLLEVKHDHQDSETFICCNMGGKFVGDVEF